MADKELIGNSEQLDCSDCVNHGGDWDCDHVQCHKGADTISRAAALDALGERPMPWTDDDDYVIGGRNQYDSDRLAIETVPSAHPDFDAYCDRLYKIAYERGKREAVQWIPCKERLPKPEEEVLLTFDYKKRRYVETGNIWSDGTAHCYADDYLTPGGRKYRKVVAWMPLPEPWEGGQDE